jgi:VWFA-related protein
MPTASVSMPANLSLRARSIAFLLSAIAVPLIHGQTFRSSVDVVTVGVTVTDRGGRFISGLHKDDFSVLEDGRRRDVVYFEDESTPVSLGILLDASGSMGDHRGVRLNLARDLISRLVTRDLESTTEWMFARFTSTVVVAQEWTTDRAAIVQPLRETRATGNTSLYDAIALSIPLVQEGHFQKKALVVVSDERETTSLVTREGALREIGEHDVRIYSIDVKTDARTTMARVAEELRHQYLLGYATAAKKDGNRHAIKVDVRVRGARVRARQAFSD